MEQNNVKIIIGLITILTVFIAGCGGSSYPREATDKLASCLAEKGVKEYGAFWCPNCAKQAEMFGKSYQILKDQGVYIECDPRCDVAEDKLPAACRGMVGQTRLCLEKNVNKYPDWEFPGGERLQGVTELSTLATRTGCEFP